MKCPICLLATGLKTREEMVVHLSYHGNNLDLLLERFAEYIVAHET
jgi:hypothetical protein